MSFIYVSAIKLAADGSTVNSDNCTGVRTATGQYSLTLGSAIGLDEALFVIQPNNGSLVNWVISSSTLQPDGVTVLLEFSTLAIFPTDSAFNFIAYKFQAGP
jgi:hypothetical protein